MKLKIFPKVVQFYDLLSKQSLLTSDAASLLYDIFRQSGQIEPLCIRINNIEEPGNLASHKINELLASTFITPIDKEDIHRLNSRQEDILNQIRQLSSRLFLFRVEKIDHSSVMLMSNFAFLMQQIHEMTVKLKNKDNIADNIKKINELTTESERIFAIALSEIYESNPCDPKAIVDLIKWSQLYDRIEKLNNTAINLANLLEGIFIKYA